MNIHIGITLVWMKQLQGFHCKLSLNRQPWMKLSSPLTNISEQSTLYFNLFLSLNYLIHLLEPRCNPEWHRNRKVPALHPIMSWMSSPTQRNWIYLHRWTMLWKSVPFQKYSKKSKIGKESGYRGLIKMWKWWWQFMV